MNRMIQQPKKPQLVNYLAHMPKKLYGENTISLGELKQWCLQNLATPEDDDGSLSAITMSNTTTMTRRIKSGSSSPPSVYST